MGGGVTEGGRPAHRRERGKYPLRGNLHTEGGLQRDLHAKRRGDYPLRGNLHKQEGDNPAQKAREVCKQRKRHTCQTKEMTHQHRKGGKDLNKGKRTYSGEKGPGQRENLHRGREKPAHSPRGAGFSCRGCLNQAAPPLSLFSYV